MEQVTIIVDARDKFSLTGRCLEHLFANTPGAHGYLVVMGGVPKRLQEEWTQRFGHRAQFIFRKRFLNQAEARNIGLREAKTRLAVVMDNDNFPRPGWLEALVGCQQETGAVMVVPVILETPRRIHTAGNDLYITTQRNGQRYGHKELRFHGLPYEETANLTRRPTDYAEMHCQLVVVEPTLRLGAYDERLLEIHEVDSGLTWRKAGHSLWFEPQAVVDFALYAPIAAAEDIRLYAWRWNFPQVHASMELFQQKWGFDISEHGTFRDWLLRHNSRLGLLPRLWPSELSLRLDRIIGAVREQLTDWMLFPKYRWGNLRKRQLGYHKWTAGLGASS